LLLRQSFAFGKQLFFREQGRVFSLPQMNLMLIYYI
jgi:hypothetical protein